MWPFIFVSFFNILFFFFLTYEFSHVLVFFIRLEEVEKVQKLIGKYT